MKTNRVILLVLALLSVTLVQNAQAFYNPSTGRWLSRDPIAEKGGNNLYAFVRNSSVQHFDKDGRVRWGDDNWTCTPPKKKSCQEIIDDEKKDLNWLKQLPNCPCSINGNPDSNVWYDPEKASQKYHPGAAQCIRSKPASDGGSGQQCCYDSNGKLITGGAAGGTPDKVAPVGPIDALRHYDADVVPFERCGWKKYLEIRPPNNGNNCGNNEL
jgi:hypothetical protein